MNQPGETVQLCPFCGGRPVVQRAMGEAFSVVCMACGAVMVNQRAVGRAALVVQWNRRKQRVNFSVKSTVKGCPFCASSQVMVGGGSSGPMVACSGCGALVSFAMADTTAQLIERWNARK